MTTNKIVFICIAASMGALLLAPPEFLRIQERALAADLVAKREYRLAKAVYTLMLFQRDPIGGNNYHALNFHQSVNAGKDNRRRSSIAAARAWERLGKAGVGAAYWNLAMFSVKYGRSDADEDRKTTGWLTLARDKGIKDAGLVLDAGPGEYGRIQALMGLGDTGAAMTLASVMHRRDETANEERALAVAANNGSIQAMSDLGWLQVQGGKGKEAEAEKWLIEAATSGDIAAASRLGDCHNHGFYFCRKRDPHEAAKWYELALGPKVFFSPPSVFVDEDFAIRLGSMSRWYSKAHGHAESAAYELGRLYALGEGVPKDTERAIELLERSNGRNDAQELLTRLRKAREESTTD